MRLLPASIGQFTKMAASAALIAFSMSACAAEKMRPEKPVPPEQPPVTNESTPIDKVTFTIDAKGNVEVVGAEGLSAKDCSLDSEAKDRCSFFDKKIQIEEVQNIFFMRYKGSNCVVVGVSTKARLICYP